jgi:primosomal replication protein N
MHQEQIRTSPTGVPVLECTIWHESQVEESASARKLAFACPARALGAVAQQLSRESSEQWLLIKGFVAPRRAAFSTKEAMTGRFAPGLIFHITEYELEKDHGI